jgi:hypothetical protein
VLSIGDSCKSGIGHLEGGLHDVCLTIERNVVSARNVGRVSVNSRKDRKAVMAI